MYVVECLEAFKFWKKDKIGIVKANEDYDSN
jgi:hypothetical protein